MPTGYTADLCDGKPQTFAEFAMQCARSFTPLASLRDSPGAPIPDSFEPRGYHREKAEGARAQLQEMDSWTPGERTAHYWEHCNRVVTQNCDMLDAAYELRQRCESMLARVRLWSPPTPDHIPLRDFMVQQLEYTLEMDATVDPIPLPRSRDDWFQERRDKVLWNIRYHDRRYSGDVENAARITRWVKALKGSLKHGVPDAEWFILAELESGHPQEARVLVNAVRAKYGLREGLVRTALLILLDRGELVCNASSVISLPA